MIHGNRLIQTDNRGQACEGEMHVVTAFDNATKKAEISGAFYFSTLRAMITQRP
ncbi:hypothetical protein [Escherichia coli]|uniref:hypothetical protein n=1 Tax=Escherichia coli TaxID=562 RepID=UPI00388F54AD